MEDRKTPHSSGKRDQNTNPAEEPSSSRLSFATHDQGLSVCHPRPRHRAASKTNISAVRLNLELPCVF